MTSMRTSLLVGALGLAGIFARWGVDQLASRWSIAFPVHTLGINVAGCFLAGIFAVLGNERQLFSPELTVALLVGFAGGFTTFSAYSLQSILLLERGQPGAMALYLVASPALGLAAAWCGLWVARH